MNTISRFRLAWIFWLIALVAASLALLGVAAGTVASVIIAFLWLMALSGRKEGMTLGAILLSTKCFLAKIGQDQNPPTVHPFSIFISGVNWRQMCLHDLLALLPLLLTDVLVACLL